MNGHKSVGRDSIHQWISIRRRRCRLVSNASSTPSTFKYFTVPKRASVEIPTTTYFFSLWMSPWHRRRSRREPTDAYTVHTLTQLWCRYKSNRTRRRETIIHNFVNIGGNARCLHLPFAFHIRRVSHGGIPQPMRCGRTVNRQTMGMCVACLLWFARSLRVARHDIFHLMVLADANVYTHTHAAHSIARSLALFLVELHASLSGVWRAAVAYNSPPMPLQSTRNTNVYISFNNLFCSCCTLAAASNVSLCARCYGLQSFAGTPAVLKCRRLFSSIERKLRRKIKEKKTPATAPAIRRIAQCKRNFLKFSGGNVLPFWLSLYQCYQNNAFDSNRAALKGYDSIKNKLQKNENHYRNKSECCLQRVCVPARQFIGFFSKNIYRQRRRKGKTILFSVQFDWNSIWFVGECLMLVLCWSCARDILCSISFVNLCNSINICKYCCQRRAIALYVLLR